MSIDSVDVIETYEDACSTTAHALTSFAEALASAGGEQVDRAAVVQRLRDIAAGAHPDTEPGSTIYAWRHESCEMDEEGLCIDEYCLEVDG